MWTENSQPYLMAVIAAILLALLVFAGMNCGTTPKTFNEKKECDPANFELPENLRKGRLWRPIAWKAIHKTIKANRDCRAKVKAVFRHNYQAAKKNQTALRESHFWHTMVHVFSIIVIALLA